MEELTEIGKFIFAEGHLAPLYPLPTQRKGGVGTSGLLVIALCGVSLDSPEDVIFIQADRSTDRKRQTREKRVEAEEWKEHQRGSREETNSVQHKTYSLCTELVKVTCCDR